MPPDRQMIGKCPKCQGDHLVCSYNHFENQAVTIDSWEHKCANCGFRETQAFRNDEPDADRGSVDPAICPYCQRQPVA